MSEDFDKPKWDVALEALINEEFEKRKRPLTIKDLQGMALLHAIRFDDILDTLMIMCIEGDWRYQNAQGEMQSITQGDYDELFKSGRTTDEGVAGYNGRWLK